MFFLCIYFELGHFRRYFRCLCNYDKQFSNHIFSLYYSTFLFFTLYLPYASPLVGSPFQSSFINFHIQLLRILKKDLEILCNVVSLCGLLEDSPDRGQRFCKTVLNKHRQDNGVSMKVL